MWYPVGVPCRRYLSELQRVIVARSNTSATTHQRRYRIHGGGDAADVVRGLRKIGPVVNQEVVCACVCGPCMDHTATSRVRLVRSVTLAVLFQRLSHCVFAPAAMSTHSRVVQRATDFIVKVENTPGLVDSGHMDEQSMAEVFEFYKADHTLIDLLNESKPIPIRQNDVQTMLRVRKECLRARDRMQRILSGIIGGIQIEEDLARSHGEQQ